MKLGVLLKKVFSDKSFYSDKKCFNSSQEVTGLSADSRKIKPGFIFVAIQGLQTDGHKFIPDVYRLGAILVVGEKKREDLDLTDQVEYLQVKDTHLFLAELAAEYYEHPSDSLLVIGVTGTSGKTTTSYLIESILKIAGFKVGVIGTIGIRYGSKSFASQFTTPDAVMLQSLLLEMLNEGCTAVVMEVSSHSLKQSRVATVAFDGVVFTNLSPEHLDFHLDLEDYFQSKSLLFTQSRCFSLSRGKSTVSVVNRDDPYGERLLNRVNQEFDFNSCFDYTLPPSLQMTASGIFGIFNGVEISSSLTGRFNGYNIIAAVSLAQSIGVSKQSIERGVSLLKKVPGRLESIESDTGIRIWVDYAHKPDALEKVLETLISLKHKDSRLILVFGCGGERDRKKRPLMGRIATQKADYVIITSDNPRNEDPEEIIRGILEGINKKTGNYEVEIDRRRSIMRAVSLAKKGDFILIAGKGHETYQIIRDTKKYFDDRHVVFEVLQMLSVDRA